MNIIKKILSKVRVSVVSLVIYPFINVETRKDFYKNYLKEKSDYALRDNPVNREHVLSAWADNCSIMENYFLDNFSFNFLKHPVIKKTMFIVSNKTWREKQLNLLKKVFKDGRLKEILKENSVGAPILTSFNYKTSSNSIHHLYHFSKFGLETGANIAEFKTVVEFGGGYGNAAKIFKRIVPNATYIIVDLPLFSSIQTVYLKTILGDKNVNVVSSKNTDVQEGKVNILSSTDKNIEILKKASLRVDLFLSTWALSESPLTVQKMVSSEDYFKAKYLLMAYQANNSSFVNADNIKDINMNYEIIYNEETNYLKNNFYLFCKRKI